MGKIHSVETCGTLDGPGVRFVVFMQGCPLRCLYCHNPDTWKLKDGYDKSVDELFEEILKYEDYIKDNGGVTVSGGEPLLQAEFVAALFKRLKNVGIHTALDTSGFGDEKRVKKVLEYTDLVLLDVKSFDELDYWEITGASIKPTLDMLKLTSRRNIEVWIRHVLVPGLTDKYDVLQDMADYLTKFKNISRVEILPFHKMGEYKWDELGYNYMLDSTNSPSEEMVEEVREIFRQKGFEVY